MLNFSIVRSDKEASKQAIDQSMEKCVSVYQGLGRKRGRRREMGEEDGRGYLN